MGFPRRIRVSNRWRSGCGCPGPLPERNTLSRQLEEELASGTGTTDRILIELSALPEVDGIVSVSPEAASDLDLRLTSWSAGSGNVAPRVINGIGQGGSKAHDRTQDDDHWWRGGQY